MAHQLPGPSLSDVHARRGAVGLAEGPAHAAGQTIGAGTGQGPQRRSLMGSRKNGWLELETTNHTVMAIYQL